MLQEEHRVNLVVAKSEALWVHLFQPKHFIQKASAFVNSSSCHQMHGLAGEMQDFNRGLKGESGQLCSLRWYVGHTGELQKNAGEKEGILQPAIVIAGQALASTLRMPPSSHHLDAPGDSQKCC